jgi:hypothetical protein
MGPRARSATTLGVLAALCVIGLMLGIRALTADLPGSIIREPGPACETRTVQKGGKVRPADVLVSVFNAGTRSGRASRTMTQLQERGFAAGESGNAPRGTDVKRVQVWVDDPDNPAARLVARQFGKGTKVVTGNPVLGIGVVVVVGDDLERLARRAPQEVVAQARDEICSPPVTRG